MSKQSNNKNSKKKKSTARSNTAAQQRKTIQAEQTRRQMWAVVLFAVGLLFLALTFIKGKKAWLWLHNTLFGLLGWSAYFIAPLILYLAVVTARDKPISSIRTKLWQVGVLILLISSATEIFTGLPQVEGFGKMIKALYEKGITGKGGGVFGLILAGPLLAFADSVGAKIIIVLALFVFAMLITGSTLLHLFQMLRKPVDGIEEAYSSHRETRRQRRALQEEQEGLAVQEETFEFLTGEEQTQEPEVEHSADKEDTAPIEIPEELFEKREPEPEFKQLPRRKAKAPTQTVELPPTVRKPRFDLDVDISGDSDPEELRSHEIVEVPELLTQETVFYDALSTLPDPPEFQIKTENTKPEPMREPFVPEPSLADFGVDRPVEHIVVEPTPEQEPVYEPDFSALSSEETPAPQNESYTRPHPLAEDIQIAKANDLTQAIENYLDDILTQEQEYSPQGVENPWEQTQSQAEDFYPKELFQREAVPDEDAKDLGEAAVEHLRSTLSEQEEAKQGLQKKEETETETEPKKASEQEKTLAEDAKKTGSTESTSDTISTEKDVSPSPEHIRIEKQTKPATEKEKRQAQKKAEAAKAEVVPYEFPPIELLREPMGQVDTNIRKELEENGKRLVETLESFGVKTKIINISRGPAVTRYELQPSAGVKISRITGLADDIALNLAAAGIRIEAPIPNKAAVGIEVPNKNIRIVRIRELLESAAFQKAKGNACIALGKDITGEDIITDISKMPHVLIAGATGSGKSVCINSIIVSILYKYSPEDVKLVMIDPKVVELGIYNSIPHLLIPVVTNAKKAAGALTWAVSEMLNRYKIFADLGVRDILGYQQLQKKEPKLAKMPQIIIIIDELADLMMAAPNEVEDSICRLAQMARAAGMHLVIATQRPSVDVITGVIKANIPSRIAFAVSSQVDSRTILDTGGAEKLLGRGDMLFYPMGAAKPTRVQGCYVTDSEVEDIVEYLKKTEQPEYDNAIVEEIEKLVTSDSGGTAADGGGLEEEDELLGDAIEIVIDAEQASISQLQRRLRVGYARAGRMIDSLEQMGIVGPHEGSKPRQVLMNQDEYMEMMLMNENALSPSQKNKEDTDETE